MLANCAGSLLMLTAFVGIVLLTAGAILTLRALRAARQQARPRMGAASRLAWSAAERARQSASAVVRPQLQLAGWWAGLRAGLRTLVTDDGEAPAPPGTPASPTPVTKDTDDREPRGP